jgi:hypothetical protein
VETLPPDRAKDEPLAQQTPLNRIKQGCLKHQRAVWELDAASSSLATPTKNRRNHAIFGGFMLVKSEISWPIFQTENMGQFCF